MSDNVLGIRFSDTDPALSVNVKEILRGYEGYSPTVTVEDAEGGHKVIITDKTGEHEFTVLDGDSITAKSIIAALRYTPADAAVLSDKQDVIDDLNDIRHGAELGATALQEVPATYRTAEQQDAIHDAMKQDVISDLSTIRNGAELGATALQAVPDTYRTAAEQDKIHDDAKADQTALETEISERKAADETLSANVDKATKIANEAKTGLSAKQDTLIAGTNITIAEDGKTISATGGGSGGSTVSVDQVLTSGTEIGGVTVDGTRTALFAPNGSSSENNYELIETITLTEDATEILRNQDPDGNDYSFSDMYILVSNSAALAGGGATVGYFILKDTLSPFNFYMSYRKISHSILHVRNGFTECISIGDQYGYSADMDKLSYIRWNNAKNTPLASIRLKTSTANPFKSGCVIKIWGIRA